VHRGVILGDSDAIRVRVRAWEPGRIGVAEPRDGHRGWEGGRSQRRAVPPRGRVDVVKVWGRVIGPGWRLRRGPGPRESVLERKPCRRG
jgi:hypothetical protein